MKRKVRQFIKELTFIEVLIMTAIGAIVLSLALGAVTAPKTQIRTICMSNGDQVLNRVTDRRVSMVGENYWEIDKDIIYADICVSHSEPIDTVVIK